MAGFTGRCSCDNYHYNLLMLRLLLSDEGRRRKVGLNTGVCQTKSDAWRAQKRGPRDLAGLRAEGQWAF
jgi:hypothetical protein